MANTATSAINFTTGGRCMTGQYSESPNSNILRSQMESGISKTARKSHRQWVTREVTYLFSSSEYSTFKTWFKDTAKDGSLFFNWVDPVSGDIIDARIVNGTYQATPLNARMNYWYVTMTFETYYA